ncbi:hypothetical protein ACOBQJ_03775 [Pelotomaculum propionicicum]|uniref:hypothetical protein n=1 Tax=Pelotomaculum propionicicum TaxID=258475 RepID=UPI003B7CBC50
MRTSEAILYAIHSSGGKIKQTQFQEWLATLIEKEYLQMEVEGEEDSVEFFIQLTDKGKQALANKGLLKK